MNRPIDIWAGIGSGQSVRLEGEMVDGKVRITDEKWLDHIGWDDPYWEYPAHKIPKEYGDPYWVDYDDYGWSEKGSVPERLISKGVSVIGTDELHSEGVQHAKGVSVTMQKPTLFDEVSEMNNQVQGKVEKILSLARERSKNNNGVIFYGTPRRK